MKRFAFAGTVGISIIAVVTLAVLEAGPKPVSYTWKARVLNPQVTNMPTNLAPGDYYYDSDASANVSVFVREYSSGGLRQYCPVFTLEVMGSPIGMNGIDVYDGGFDPDLVCCGFPGQNPPADWLGLQAGWMNFLNGAKSGYQRMLFTHEGPRFSTSAAADFANMAIGDQLVMMRLYFLMQGQDPYGPCDQCSAADYHQVEGQTHGANALGDGADIQLLRKSQDTWWIIVNTSFGNHTHDGWPATFNSSDDQLWESYCDCTTATVGKRVVSTKSVYKSSWVKAHLAYVMEFTRTPK